MILLLCTILIIVIKFSIHRLLVFFITKKYTLTQMYNSIQKDIAKFVVSVEILVEILIENEVLWE